MDRTPRLTRLGEKRYGKGIKAGPDFTPVSNLVGSGRLLVEEVGELLVGNMLSRRVAQQQHSRFLVMSFPRLEKVVRGCQRRNIILIHTRGALGFAFPRCRGG